MENKQYPADYFTLVQDEERLRDKPLKTKQLSYFQDAMLRFTKNKYNVIATIIVIIFILMSIVVPMITPKDLYTRTNSLLTTLPPRVPIIEKLGILDGTKLYQGQSIDYTTIDPETGLGYPTDGFSAEYIDFSTLTNYTITGSERKPQYIGGTNILYIDSKKTSLGIQVPEAYVFQANASLLVNIESMTDGGTVEVYYLPSTLIDTVTSWDEYTLLDTLNTAGEHTIDLSTTVNAGDNGVIALRYVLPSAATVSTNNVVLNSVTITYPDTTQNVEYSGYDLAMFAIKSYSDAENGRFVRKDAVMTVADFRYDEYSALFADKPQTIGATEYNQILADNPGMEDTIVVNPDNPDNEWTFADGYPLSSVTSVDSITIGGVVYSNYHVMMNGKYQLGFEKMPYFLFGTDVFGKDLFTLIWLGLRTSLLLGIVASLTNILVGVVWGAFSAYYGGQVDILMERFTDIWGSFPQITMIGIISVLIGPGFMALYIFIVYDGWIRVAKITRLQFYRYKGREYVLAARTLGASDIRIIFKHILPNTLGTIVTRVILSIPSVIFLEMNLSYLGFGIGNGQAIQIGPISLTGTSIGVILNDGKNQIFAGNLWMITFPTFIVATLMIAFNMFGNALRDALNPQLRGSE